MCDVGDLSQLAEHTWCIVRHKKNIYAQTSVTIDGVTSRRYFHTLKCPDWPKWSTTSARTKKRTGTASTIAVNTSAMALGGSMRKIVDDERTTRAA